LSDTAMSVFENMIIQQQLLKKQCIMRIITNSRRNVYLSDGNWVTIQSYYPTQIVDIFNITFGCTKSKWWPCFTVHRPKFEEEIRHSDCRKWCFRASNFKIFPVGHAPGPS
jgi:hypothetical protein